MKLSLLLSLVFLIVGLSLSIILGPLINIPNKTVTIVVSGNETVERTITEAKPTTIEQTVTITVTFTVTSTFYNTSKPSDPSCIIFRATRDVYKVSDIVVLVLENSCDFVLILPNSAPWRIVDSNDMLVYSPIALQVIKEIKPGYVVAWAWDQRDNDGGHVPAGRYSAKLITINAGILVDEFMIIENSINHR